MQPAVSMHYAPISLPLFKIISCCCIWMCQNIKNRNLIFYKHNSIWFFSLTLTAFPPLVRWNIYFCVHSTLWQHFFSTWTYWFFFSLALFSTTASLDSVKMKKKMNFTKQHTKKAINKSYFMIIKLWIWFIWTMKWLLVSMSDQSTQNGNGDSSIYTMSLTMTIIL